MAVEIWGSFGPKVAITLTPVGEGRLEVYLNGDQILDRKAEQGKYPGLDRVRQIKDLIREKLGE